MGASRDIEGTKPIVIVGTHADRLSKQEQAIKTSEMEQLFPTRTIGTRTRNQIQGHFAISLIPGKEGGLSSLKTKLLEIGLSHPKIGIGSVQVPCEFVTLQKELELIKYKTPFLTWQSYSNSFGMPPYFILALSTLNFQVLKIRFSSN